MDASKLPVGKYEAHAVEGELGKSKAGDPIVYIRFELDDPNYKGLKIVWNKGSLKLIGSGEKSPRKRTEETLFTCGWDGESWADIRFTPTKVRLEIEHEEYNGKLEAKIKWINSLTKRYPLHKNPLTIEEKNQINAELKASNGHVKAEVEEELPF